MDLRLALFIMSLAIITDLQFGLYDDANEGLDILLTRDSIFHSIPIC